MPSEFMPNEKIQSQTISFQRFPLIVGVVLIHSYFSEVVINGVDLMKNGIFPIYSTVSFLFSQIISRIAVPLFFFISGYLFFFKINLFTREIYLQKLKKKVQTILIPYIFWNLLVIAFFFMSQTFLPGLMSGENKLIADYSIFDWFWAFWNTKMINPNIAEAYPICYQFWFIRVLMVVMLFFSLDSLFISKVASICCLMFGYTLALRLGY